MSKIEWTNKTWNPIIGCSKISEGCKNCYAEKMACRLANIYPTSETYGEVISYTKEWLGNTYFVQSAFSSLLKRKKPTKYFVCSMGDLFHESVQFGWIERVMIMIQKCKQHTFQILTKRPERMQEFFDWFYEYSRYCTELPLQNLWIGVTAENQEQANNRIPVLLKIPAKHHFVSCEPLLSSIILHPWLEEYILPSESMHHEVLNGLDWVIAGPETGPNKRPMQKRWIENIYNQCKAAYVPFFDKKDTLGLNLKQFPND